METIFYLEDECFKTIQTDRKYKRLYEETINNILYVLQTVSINNNEGVFIQKLYFRDKEKLMKRCTINI